MTDQSFDVWFDTVRRLTPIPVDPDDQWYDAYLYALDPRQALAVIRPVQRQERRRSFWAAVQTFFN
jgi:hypothetical protein